MKNTKIALYTQIIILVAFIFTSLNLVSPLTVKAAETGYWQLVKAPKDYSKTTDDYKVEYSGDSLTYSSYHAYGDNKVVKFTLETQLPDRLNPGDTLKLTSSAEVVSIKEGLDQANPSGVVTIQGGIEKGKIYSIVQGMGSIYPKKDTVSATINAGSSSPSAPDHNILVRFDCDGYDASQENNWWVYEWVKSVPQVVSMKIDPASYVFTGAGSKQLKVMAKLSDGSSKDITADADTEYDVDDEDVVTVSSKGLVKTAVAAKNGDTAEITVQSGDVESICKIKISIINLKTLKSSTSNVVLQAVTGKNTKQLKITAVYPNGKQEVVTSKAQYISSDSKYFTVSNTGMLKVTPGAPGGKSGSITASYGNKSCKITVKVK